MNPLLGLMFWKSTPVTFIWKTAKIRGIHSFLCLPFTAIYWKDNSVVAIKEVQPNQWNVKPDVPFDKLEEIPL